MAVQITNLGFPVGDEVKNQTSVQLVIATDFLSLLSGVKGEHKFVMEVTDNDGNTVTKSLMLKSI